MNICTHTNGTRNLNFWTSLVFACLLATGISACGGGGGSTTSAPETPPATLISPGAYIGSLVGKSDNLPKDFVTILLPTESASGGLTKFYALHFDDANPDLYSGAGQITGTSSASLTQVSYYPYLATAVRNGTGTLSSISSGEVRASFNFPSTTSNNALAINNLDHKFPTGYVYNSPASLNLAQGNWQGNLSFGSGSNGAFTINISSTGVLSSLLSFLGDCQFSQGALTPSFDGTNLYKLTVNIPNATYCTQSNFGGKAITGAAFITSSPVAGKTQRLYLVGVTTDGRGISFKADR
jgi:hypothetical protein